MELNGLDENDLNFHKEKRVQFSISQTQSQSEKLLKIIHNYNQGVSEEKQVNRNVLTNILYNDFIEKNQHLLNK